MPVQPGLPNPRTQLAATARGLISEVAPIAGSAASAIPVTGTANGSLSLALLGLRAGDRVTNIIVFCQTAGTGLTFVKLGLYDSTGHFLKATAESSASFNTGSNVFKVIALTAAYTVPSDGGYYCAYLQFGSGATGASLARMGTGTSTGAQIGSAARSHASIATQTDISGDITLADGNNAWWFGVS